MKAKLNSPASVIFNFDATFFDKNDNVNKDKLKVDKLKIWQCARENISLSYVMKTMGQWDKVHMYLL